MGWIETVNEGDATGPLESIYRKIQGDKGELVPNIYKIQSLAPAALTIHERLYRELMFGRSPLKRYQREMIATRVSVLNECHY